MRRAVFIDEIAQPFTAGKIVIASTLQPRRKGTIRRETRGRGDKGTRGQGDKETGRQGDRETRRQGDRETRGQGGRNMRSILLIAFIAFVGSSAHAQWYPVTSGTTENLHDIVFIDKDRGYCGGDGVILRTTDGGEGWETIFSADS